MEFPRAPRFGLGLFWPDDYTDYLVHLREPFEVFRLEIDREGPMIFWVAPDSHYESMADGAFEEFARAARMFLGLQELIELGTSRQVELRVTQVPFPPLLMLHSKEDSFHGILGLGDEAFLAILSSDESEPLINEVELGFESAAPGLANELGEFAEAFYNEFYDRQDHLDKTTDQPGGKERRGGEHGFSRN